MPLKYEDMLRDPIYGYIYVTKLEEDVINTPYFQRLRFIKQTPGAAFVYPSANHTRFEHSLGVMHLAGELAEKLIYRDERLMEKAEGEKDKLIQKVRLTGLLHDIGHGPFSHVFEEFLNDVNARVNHEDFSELIIREKIHPILERHDFDDTDVIQITDWLRDREYGIGSVVVQSINVDALDYLTRDAYHTGTIEYGWVDVKRIIDNMLLIRLTAEEEDDLRTNGIVTLREVPERRNLDKAILAISDRAIIAVESFFLSRLQMFKAVYYHRTARAIERGLVKCMEEIANDVPILKLFTNMSKKEELLPHVGEFVSLNDYFLVGKILEKECAEIRAILDRKQRRTAYEKTETASVDEFGLYARSLERRKGFEDAIMEKLSEENIDVRVVLDVPFPLLPINVGKVYIKYDEEGTDRIAAIRNYGRLDRESAPILKRMIAQNMLWMIEQRVLADTDKVEELRKIGNIARSIMEGGPSLHI